MRLSPDLDMCFHAGSQFNTFESDTRKIQDTSICDILYMSILSVEQLLQKQACLFQYTVQFTHCTMYIVYSIKLCQVITVF